MITMSAKEYQAMLQKQASAAPKYRNKYVYIYEDGLVCHEKDFVGHGKVLERVDSVKEYNRGKELELLAKAGHIQNLQKQVSLMIQDAFVDKCGKNHRATTYQADFVYEKDGVTIVEDVKGIDRKTGKIRTTEAFRLKWKLLQSKYPEYEFRIY